jgi:hypothetical protein
MPSFADCQNATRVALVLSAVVLSVAQAFVFPAMSNVASNHLLGLTANVVTVVVGGIGEVVARSRSQDALEGPLLGGDVKQMAWRGKFLSKNMFRVGLPRKLSEELLAYANRMGITDLYNDLVVEDRPYQPGEEKMVTFQQHNWMVHRPRSEWASNMHWASPADESAHDDYLRVLSAGGFDEVLEGVGNYFGLEGLCAYHLSFIGVSQCEKGLIHIDVDDSGGMAFNMIIPLILEKEGPELELLSDEETTEGGGRGRKTKGITSYYKYEPNVASMIGDNALHATAPCDYRKKGKMRIAATVYIGDITPANVQNILLSLTQAYPPVGNAKHLLDRAGSHWSKSDPSKKLPVSVTPQQ